MLRWRECIGLGEMMNYPGVLAGDVGALSKITSARNKVVDGHAPGLTSKDLEAYIAAGMNSDHESVTLAEASEKLKRGMFVMSHCCHFISRWASRQKPSALANTGSWTI